MSDSEEKSRDCRPSRAEQRREAFLEAARAVFLEQGYDAASMAEIVSRAGGSLSTLYAQFGDKQGLFFAMIDERMREMANAMQVELSAHTPAREGLARIGRHFLEQVLYSGGVGMYRTIVSLASKYPDISREFLQRGQMQVREALVSYLKDREDAGELTLKDPLRTANVFIDMVRGALFTRALLDPDYDPTREEIAETVEAALEIFLNGIARR